MTSYQFKIISCPACKKWLQILEVASCNTINATFYTDGFVSGPMYDEGGSILSCPLCDTKFWRTDVVNSIPERDPEYFKHKKNHQVPSAYKLDLSSYPSLLTKKLWRNSEEEIYVRIRAWWAYNGHSLSFFILKSEPPHSVEAKEANCERLLQLLDSKDDDDETILCAEICRELGKFEECLALLDRPFPNKYEQVLRVIRTLASKKDSNISEIK